MQLNRERIKTFYSKQQEVICFLSTDKDVKTSEYAVVDTFLASKIFHLQKLTKPEICPMETNRESEGLRHSTKLGSCYGD